MSLHPAVNLPPPAQGLGDPPSLGRGLPRSSLVSWLTLPLLTQHQLAEDLPSLAWTGHQALLSSSLPFRRWWAIKRCPNDHCSCQILGNQCPGGESAQKWVDASSTSFQEVWPSEGHELSGCPGRAGTRTWAQMPALCPPLSVVLAEQELGAGVPLTRAALAPWDHQLCLVCQTGSHWDSGPETESSGLGNSSALGLHSCWSAMPADSVLSGCTAHVCPVLVSAHAGWAMPGVVAGRWYSVSGERQTHPDPMGRADKGILLSTSQREGPSAAGGQDDTPGPWSTCQRWERCELSHESPLEWVAWVGSQGRAKENRSAAPLCQATSSPGVPLSGQGAGPQTSRGRRGLARGCLAAARQGAPAPPLCPPSSRAEAGAPPQPAPSHKDSLLEPLRSVWAELWARPPSPTWLNPSRPGARPSAGSSRKTRSSPSSACRPPCWEAKSQAGSRQPTTKQRAQPRVQALCTPTRRLLQEVSRMTWAGSGALLARLSVLGGSETHVCASVSVGHENLRVRLSLQPRLLPGQVLWEYLLNA